MIHFPNFDALDLCKSCKPSDWSAFRHTSIPASKLTEIPKLELPIPIRLWVPVQHAQTNTLLGSLLSRARGSRGRSRVDDDADHVDVGGLSEVFDPDGVSGAGAGGRGQRMI